MHTEKQLISSLSRDNEVIDYLVKQRNDDKELFREIYELLENLVVDPTIDFGPTILKTVLGREIVSPYQTMLDTVNVPRYEF